MVWIDWPDIMMADFLLLYANCENRDRNRLLSHNSTECSVEAFSRLAGGEERLADGAHIAISISQS